MEEPKTTKALAIRSDFEAANSYASVLIKSPQTRKEYRQKESAFYVIQKGLELGISPILSLEQINFIKGKCATSVELMLALVYNSGLMEDITHVTTGDIGKKEHEVVCKVKRRGMKSYVERSFSLEDASRAGLQSNENWRKYPQRMLEKRAYGWALRDAFPDVIQGLFTNEEAQDMLPPPVKVGETFPLDKFSPKAKPIDCTEPVVQQKKQEPEVEKAEPIKVAPVKKGNELETIHSWFEEDESEGLGNYINYLCEKSGVPKEVVISSILSRKEKFTESYLSYSP